MADKSFGLVRSFHVDNGELDGESPQQCFVLGYELAQIDQQVKSPVAFDRPVHSQNRERIEEACKDAGREYSLTFMQDDPSESWLWLRVAGIPAG